MKHLYQFAGTAMMLLAAFLVRESLSLNYYTPLGPGPGFFPFWLSLLLAILSVAMILQATFGKGEAMSADFYAKRKGYLNISAVLGALIGVIVLMKTLGFIVTMLAFYTFLLQALGRQGILMTGIIAVVGSFGVYYLFLKLLSVPLPIGIFGF